MEAKGTKIAKKQNKTKQKTPENSERNQST